MADLEPGDPRKPGYEGPYKFEPLSKPLSYPFDGPDDADYVEKMEKLLPYSLLFGATAGLMNLMAWAPRVDNVYRVGRILSFSAFGGALLASYVTTSYLSAKLRSGKTDAWNHVLAGASTGALLGMKTRSHTTGWALAVVLGMSTGLVKQAKLDGFQFHPTRTTAYQFGITPDHYTKGVFCKRPSVLGIQDDD